ncbi:unnamed protein product, partial [Meganyctiphanes norvegica]
MESLATKECQVLLFMNDLLSCSRTFFNNCYIRIIGRIINFCFTCRKPHTEQRPALLPTNYALINLVDTKNKNKQENKCDPHNDVIQFWCKVCDKQLCGLCLFENHMAHGDKVSKIVEFIASEKAEIKKKGQQHSAKLAEQKSQSCRKFIQALLEVVRNKTSEQLLNQCISQAERLGDVNQILYLRDKMDRIISEKELVKDPSEYEDLSISRDKRKKPRLKHKYFIFGNMKSQVSNVPNIPEENAQLKSLRIPILSNDEANCGSNSCSGSKTKKRKWNLVEEEESRSNHNKIFPEVENADYTLAFGKSPTTTNDQICSFHQKSSNSYANLIWKNQRFHLYALSPGNKGQIKIDISVLQEYLSSHDQVEVFMELSESNMRDRIVPLGCVYIRVDARMRNGQQFLAMCLGSLGISYKGAMFNGVCEEGRGLWCGQYCDGFRWTDRVTINCLGHKDCTEIKPGLVRLHKGAAFTIYTQNVPDKLVRCCVGEVVSGMAVVEAAIQNNDPTKVIIISNVGLVLPDDK